MSFAGETRQRSAPVLPMAAMVDMLFLLLIFFLYQASQRDQERELPVQLQSASSAQDSAAVTPIVISVDDQNRIFIGPRQYTVGTLRSALEALAGQLPNESVVVRGDKTADLGIAVQVMDMARSVGLKNVVLATAKQ